MEENLFIVHSSAIIRSGLTAILQEFFKFEITQLNSIDELNPFNCISDRIIIILIQDGFKLPPTLEAKLKQNNQLLIIAISPYEKEHHTSGYYDFKINLEASPLQIQQIIQLAKNAIVKHKNSPIINSEELTQREIEVIKKIALGLANKDIADSLNISIHTVISHRKNITEKLNIKSISGLTVYAIMNKLLDISDINPNELI